MNFRYCLLILLMLLISKPGSSQQVEEMEVYEEWRVQKDQDGIQIYARWLQAEADRKARQYRIEMQVDATLSEVVATIMDDKNALRWVNRAKEFYHFEKKDNFNWYSYTELSIPWPMNNQDLVTRNFLSQDLNSKFIRIQLTGEATHIPLKKNIERMAHFEGSWDMTPLPNGKTLVQYYIFTGQRPWIPRWIIDPIIQGGLIETFDTMREVIYEKKQLGIKLNYIRD